MNRKKLKQRVAELEADLRAAAQPSVKQYEELIPTLRKKLRRYEDQWESVISWVNYLQPLDPMKILAKGSPTIRDMQGMPMIRAPDYSRRVRRSGEAPKPTFDEHNLYLFKLRVEQRAQEELTVLMHYSGRDYYVTANYAKETDKAELERQIAKMLTYELRST